MTSKTGNTMFDIINEMKKERQNEIMKKEKDIDKIVNKKIKIKNNKKIDVDEQNENIERQKLDKIVKQKFKTKSGRQEIAKLLSDCQKNGIIDFANDNEHFFKITRCDRD